MVNPMATNLHCGEALFISKEGQFEILLAAGWYINIVHELGVDASIKLLLLHRVNFHTEPEKNKLKCSISAIIT